MYHGRYLPLVLEENRKKIKFGFTSAGTWMLPAALASRRKRMASFSWVRYSFTYFSARSKISFFLAAAACVHACQVPGFARA